jgi:hypothetical protein
MRRRTHWEQELAGQSRLIAFDAPAAAMVRRTSLLVDEQKAAVKRAEKDGRFQCPKHNSRFGSEGVRLSGVAQATSIATASGETRRGPSSISTTSSFVPTRIPPAGIPMSWERGVRERTHVSLATELGVPGQASRSGCRSGCLDSAAGVRYTKLCKLKNLEDLWELLKIAGSKA